MMKAEEYHAKYGIDPWIHKTLVRPWILKRDGFKCTEKGCSYDKDQSRLHVHHEDYNNQNINTMRTVCADCHAKIPKGANA